MSTRPPTSPTAKTGATATAAPAAKAGTPPVAAAKPAGQPTTSASQITTQVPTERIAKRAYEKWLKRGCGHGNDIQDWIEAEKEVMAELKGNTTTGTMRR